MSQRSSQIARWGLLVTTVALGAVLVGMGLAGYLGARETSEEVVRARGVDLSVSVRRALARSEGNHQTALEEIVEDLGEQGLRYAAVVTPGRGVVAVVGESTTPLSSYQSLVGQSGNEPMITWDGGDRARVVSRARPRRGPRGWAQKRRHGKRPRIWGDGNALKGPHKRGKQGAPVPSGQGGDGKRLGPRPRAIMVLEYEPVVAETITSRSLSMLLISLVAATMLLAAALVFWRLSRKAERMSEQLSKDRQLKALGEMSAVLGHELRNPLAALKGHAQLLVELLGEDHPGRRGADTVVREAIRMESLTGQILEFAKRGTVELQPERPAAVAEASVEQSGLLGIELEVAEKLPLWPLDRGRMERVLVNLLRNASQASDGDGVVEMSVVREEGGLVFAVRDHGIGIPPGEEKWIFEPFHTKRVQGTGLGLAVAKRIVEAHDGSIVAENHPEGGAIFKIWLPPH